MHTVKSWVNKNLKESLKTLEELLKDSTISPNTRMNVAKDIIKLHAFFYAQQDGVATPTGKAGKKEDSGGIDNILSLKFNGTTDN